MDLGIAGKTAIVCAGSKGLGRGCAMALAENGVHLVLNARGAEALEATAAEIRAATGVRVETVVADITTEAGRAAVLASAPTPDILINNAGGPPPGDFRDWDDSHWLKALNANMLSPIALIKATVDGMAERGFGRVVNITSSAVKAPIDTLGLSNGARSGLTGFVAGTARAMAGTGVTINNLLPGRFATDRLWSNLDDVAKRTGQRRDAVEAAARKSIPAGRFGEPAEFGAYCAFLCSVHAGFVTAQNVLIDGGAYPGTF